MKALEIALAKRLENQRGQGGRGKTLRRWMRRGAVHGLLTLPSGFGRTLYLEATV